MKTGLAAAVVLTLVFAMGHAGAQVKALPDDNAISGSESRVPSTVGPEVLEMNFLWALDCDVDGVVEDAIRETAKMKLDDPTFDSRAIRKKLDELSEHGNSPTIRYRASLTRIVFEYPELFSGDNLQCCKEGEELFSGIVHCLERTRYAR